jgi:hypothetical protein
VSDHWVYDSENQEYYFWKMRRYKKYMSKLPEGRKPLPNEWFVDRANIMQPEDKKEKPKPDKKEE